MLLLIVSRYHLDGEAFIRLDINISILVFRKKICHRYIEIRPTNAVTQILLMHLKEKSNVLQANPPSFTNYFFNVTLIQIPTDINAFLAEGFQVDSRGPFDPGFHSRCKHADPSLRFTQIEQNPLAITVSRCK